VEKIDQRNRLQEQPFDYKVTKANKMLIYWDNKLVEMLNEKETARFLARIANKSDFEVQLELAKVTGHFKHGNER